MPKHKDEGTRNASDWIQTNLLNYIYLNLDYTLIIYLRHRQILKNWTIIYFIWLSVCSLPEVHVECVVHELDVDVFHGENIQRHLLVRSMTHLILHASLLSPSPWHTQVCLHSLAELSCHSQPGPSRDVKVVHTEFFNLPPENSLTAWKCPADLLWRCSGPRWRTGSAGGWRLLLVWWCRVCPCCRVLALHGATPDKARAGQSLLCRPLQLNNNN